MIKYLKVTNCLNDIKYLACERPSREFGYFFFQTSNYWYYYSNNMYGYWIYVYYYLFYLQCVNICISNPCILLPLFSITHKLLCVLLPLIIANIGIDIHVYYHLFYLQYVLWLLKPLIIVKFRHEYPCILPTSFTSNMYFEYYYL